jgi:2-hydroxy-3-keto-5-methylthiopentenyl-1-phosphate phosphatase
MTQLVDQRATASAEAWRQILAGCQTDLALLDLDGTVWDDLLVVLNEEFGPVEGGEKKWKQYDRAFKVLCTMTNGAHLEAEYRDLLTAKGLEDIIAWLKINHKLVAGVKEFLAFLRSNNVTPVAISNGAYEIADAMLAHHGVTMPRVCNSLVFEDGKFVRMDFFHNEHDGIRKGDLVKAAVEAGHRIVCCGGDSKGDISLVEETVKAGGLAIAVGNHGLSAWCEQNLPNPDTYVCITDYAEAMQAVQQRIGGR